jgi:energy-coupling factor transporter ATP-binding protein EcfA2
MPEPPQDREQQMYISQVLLEGVRSFHGERSVDLSFTGPDDSHAGWTVIAGRNGSGKTTLLRAIVLALGGPARALQLAPATKDWISIGSSVGTVQVELIVDPDVDRPKIGRLPAKGSFWTGLEWRTEVDTERTTEVRPEPLLVKNPSNVRKAAHNASWSEQPVGWFYAAYGPFRRLLGEGSEATRLMLGPLPLARVATLFREDASLAEGVQWLRFHHLRRLEKRPGADEAVTLVLDMLNDGLLPDGFAVDDVDSEGLWLRRGKDRLPLDEMSDGYRAVTALVVDMVRSIIETTLPSGSEAYGRDARGRPRVYTPGVVLIDEVEAHLHVSWQRRIGPWLCEHFPNVQFITTTHSPYVCQAAKPGGLIRLSGPNDPEPPRVLTSVEQRRIIHGTADEAVVSDLFGLESLYTDETRALRYELSRLETRYIVGEAAEPEVQRYEDLREELQSSPLERVHELQPHR